MSKPPILYRPSFPAPTPPRTTSLTESPAAERAITPGVPYTHQARIPPGQLRNIVDGFMYNTELKPYIPDRYFPLALAQMEILRRAVNFRPRWFVIPDDISQPIQPYSTLYYQIQISGGSWLWGYNFNSISALDPNGDPTETTAGDICVQMVESCTGIPLFMDFANGGGCNANFQSRCIPIILRQARPISDPGVVNVELTNRTGNTITCQALVHFAEPCKIITEEELEKEAQIRRMFPPQAIGCAR
jgi:hypothetical protein